MSLLLWIIQNFFFVLFLENTSHWKLLALRSVDYPELTGTLSLERHVTVGFFKKALSTAN